MFWIILLVICIIAIIVGVNMAKNDALDVLGMLLCILGVASLLTTIIVIPMEYYSERESINTFIIQSEYLENHLPKNNIEDAALTTKKIELNDWLYKAQYQYENLHMFNFYDDSIMDLKPID